MGEGKELKRDEMAATAGFKFDNREIICNFCGKKKEQVSRLIAGPGVCICNECIIICNDILNDEAGEKTEGEGCCGKCGSCGSEKNAVEGYQLIIPPITEEFENEYTISISIKKEKK